MKNQCNEGWRTQWVGRFSPPERLVAEFWLRLPDNHVLVFASARAVHIHTTRAFDPPERGSAFVRMLATEGFIADAFALCARLDSTPNLRWTVGSARTRSAAALYWRQNWPVACAWLLLLLSVVVADAWAWRHADMQIEYAAFM